MRRLTVKRWPDIDTIFAGNSTHGYFVGFCPEVNQLATELLPEMETDDIDIVVSQDPKTGRLRSYLAWAPDRNYRNPLFVEMDIPPEVKAMDEREGHKWILEQLVSRYRLMRYNGSGDRFV